MMAVPVNWSGTSPKLFRHAYDYARAARVRQRSSPAMPIRCSSDRGLLKDGELLHKLYDAGPKLGSGRFGVVRVARNKRTGEEFAVKTIPKSKVEEREYLQEIDVMQRLGKSLSCCYLYGAYDTGNHVHLVMELCRGGQLLDGLCHARGYDEGRAAELVRAVLRTVAQCHACNICYRDVKPDNFLFLEEDPASSRLKGTDFGISTHVRNGEVLTSRVGTPHYMAPEVIAGSYGMEADVWSAGCIAWQLLTGERPFADDINAAFMKKKVFRAIQEDFLDFSGLPVSDDARDLLRGLLERDPARRLSAAEALQHPWIQGDQLRAGSESRWPLSASVVQRLQRNALQSSVKKEALRAVARRMVEAEDARLVELRRLFISMGARGVDGDAGEEAGKGRPWGGLTATCRELADGLADAGFDLTVDEERQLVADLSDHCVVEGDEMWDCGSAEDEVCDAVAEHEILLEDFVVGLLDWDSLLQNDTPWQRWAEEVFYDVFDKDGDGKVTMEELMSVLPGESTQALRDALDEADTDSDGLLSMEEFLRMLREDSGEESLGMFESRLSMESGAALQSSS